MATVKPDFAWYSAESARLGLKSPRCPFASVHACPRYYQSLSLLGEAGCTPIPKAEDDALLAKWKKHPLWPATGEQTTSISGGDGEKNSFGNFCPEVAYDTFRLFATYLGRHIGEIDRELAASRLSKEGAAHDDPRWIWANFTPQHYSECPLYSPLSHDWVKHVTPAIAASAAVRETLTAHFDVFISHASEDKDVFVRPLAAELVRLGLRVWYDEWTLKLGDSLRQRIDEGLVRSRFGVVVLSRDFFAKNWTNAELDGLFANEMQGKNVILPVWHNVSKEEVTRYSPMLAGKMAALTNKGVDAVAAEIFSVVRPGAARPPITHSPAKTVGNHSVHKAGRYAVELGQRHKYLREKVLRINPRRMADFYSFEKVAQLEACERGEDEFPAGALKTLREFFFVKREFLEGEDAGIFEPFEVTDSEGSSKYPADGFSPYLLCLNEDRDKLWCWPAFYKEQDGFDRIITADTYGYFASRGGGKSNIMSFIEAVHRQGLDAYDVSVQKVDRAHWNQLETRTYYHKGMGGLRGPDHDGQDCFIVWWKEFEDKQGRIQRLKDQKQ